MTRPADQFLSSPAKTFLVGEYAVLNNCPALILCTKPRFQLNARVHNQPKQIGIHPQSPAGQFIQSHPDFYSVYQLEFVDPYAGAGGLGASTAQFALVYALMNPTTNSQDWLTALEHYRKIAWNGQGIPPSGADLISQFAGHLCYYHPYDRDVKTYEWPFPEIEFCLIHTGNKLATHHYLEKLTPIDTTDLERIVDSAIHGLIDKDPVTFTAAINHYAEALHAQNLVADKTQALLQQIKKQSYILAAKGCGAMGNDIIVVILEKSNRDVFLKWLKKMSLSLIYCGQELSPGIHRG